MATYKGTFKSIFEDTISEGNNNIKLQKIIIPRIQRDYAQGRETNEITRVRERFIAALYNAITNTPITLDFIYGDIDKDGIMTPLDGQQRLTTLFLLYWYAAKKENIDPDEYAFLSNFTYDTRYSARDFCGKILNYTPSFAGCISKEIIDQSWFPLDWKNDPTISSMLTMIDCINEHFSELSHIWSSLENNAITFFFLPIKDMGLSDELYIKMNSRGKPLTLFEHFKAELESYISEVDEDIARIIAHKIDVSWTDLLWIYRNDELIDDDFLHYFRFICSVIYYKEGDTPVGKNPDIFYLAKRNFSKDNPNARENIDLLIDYFDCWVQLEKEEGIQTFFNSVFSKTHKKGSIIYEGRSSNIFSDCLVNYGEKLLFPIQRFMILYAVIQYLLNSDNISREDFIRRLRIVNNLVNNSKDDVTDSINRDGGNRVPAALQAIDIIINSGLLNGLPDKNFNTFQINEEISKQDFLETHPDKAELLYRAEDHRLLYGQISIIGIDNYELFDRFSSLFDCSLDKIDCALMAIGDYKQEERKGRCQLGSSTNSKAWQSLFHKSSASGYENTQRVLVELLSQSEQFTDSVLDEISNEYTKNCEHIKQYDWRYYYIKYNVFRPGRYGKYSWYDYSTDPFDMTVWDTMSRVSSNAYNPFLKEISKHYPNTALVDYGTKVQFGNNKCVLYEDSEYCLYSFDNISDESTYELIDSFTIPSQGEYDHDDRVKLLRNWLENIIRVVPSSRDNTITNNNGSISLVGKHIAKTNGSMSGVIINEDTETITVIVYSGPRAGQKVSVQKKYLDKSYGIYVVS